MCSKNTVNEVMKIFVPEGLLFTQKNVIDSIIKTYINKPTPWGMPPQKIHKWKIEKLCRILYIEINANQRTKE